MVALNTEAWSRLYEDTYDYANTPEKMEAEQAYRRSFLDAARIAAKWSEPDLAMLEAAWEQRRAVRSAAEVEEGGMVYYKPGHSVAAAEARGKVQAFEHVTQAWDELADEGVSDEMISAFVLPLWLERVEKWATKEIDPAHIHIPPWMSHMPEARRLATAKNAAASASSSSAPSPAAPAPGAIAAPAMRTVRELLCMYTDLRRPVLHGLLREGETLNLISMPKTGKSWLATDLALALATGRPWLNTFETVKGDVLLIDNELHPETTAHRIPLVAKARNIPLDDFMDAVCVDNLRGRLQDLVSMEPYFTAIKPGRFKLIVLDAFYRFVPRGTDENDNSTIAMLYNHLDRHAQRLGCAFVLIHHASKGNQSAKSVTDVGAGAGSQSRATDSHLVLRAHEQENVVVLEAAVRSWPPVAARCLKWDFPVFNTVDGLDPAALRPERPRRRHKGAAGGGDTAPEAKEKVWTLESFAKEFITTAHRTADVIIGAATDAGMSERKAKKMLRAAVGEGRVECRRQGNNRPAEYALSSSMN